MNPRTIFILALCALAWSFVIYKCIERAPENNLRGSTESRRALKPRHGVGVEVAKAPPSGTAIAPSPSSFVSGDRVPPSQSPIDAEAQRVINALVDLGMSPERAHEHYTNSMAFGTLQRRTRLPMPGVRTNADPKRWPLFEDADSPKP